MDKLFVRKDVYDDLIEKWYGKRDLSKLTKKQITDKNGHKRTVYVRNGEQPVAQNQPKAQNELSPEKKARYEEMLEKVKSGSDENALYVAGKGMLNKKDAIAYLEGKLGKTKSSSKTVGQKMADNEDKAFAQSERDAKKKYGDMSIEELKAEAKKYDGVSKYSPEANEARKIYDILNQKLEEEKKNNTSKPKKTENAPAAENKKEIDRLMKIGFDRRSAYAKVALDKIEERLDVEKDKSIREKLFDDMRDIQTNGLNAKYFDNHREEFGL